MKYDYLIVGAGLYGSICAHELSRKNKRCLVIERRDHIGGNCYTNVRSGINVHVYGPHIFHTSNDAVWQWINQFTDFNGFRLSPVANYKGEIFSLPFSMWTFNKLWGVTHPDAAKKIIQEQGSLINGEPTNLEEQAIKTVGLDIYKKLIEGYTAKQWMRSPKTLPKEIIKRLPIRYTYDNNYFSDRYQGIPVNGYTPIFEKLLDRIDVRLGVDFLKTRDFWLNQAKKIIFTGPIDEFFNFSLGALEYKTTRFEHKEIDVDNYQGVAIMNYTDIEVPHTRVIEHKHFESCSTSTTWVTWEFPERYIAGKTEPYYPVNDVTNTQLYSSYKNLALQFPNVDFCGRLGEYKYYDMHQVIEKALQFVAGIPD